MAHIVHTDAKPFLPPRWKVLEHRGQGNLTITRGEGQILLLNEKRLDLYLPEGQQDNHGRRGYLKGTELRNKLATKVVLNANVLDYLIAHPELILERWYRYRGVGFGVCFWGTIYYGYPEEGGDLCIRKLYRRDGQFVWGYHRLSHDFDDENPTAVLED